MRKPILAITALAVGCVLAVPTAQAAPSTSDTNRRCADVVEGWATFETNLDKLEPTTADVRAQMELADTFCHNVTYTMTVLTSQTEPTVLAKSPGIPSAPMRDEPPRVEFRATLPYPGPDGVVCVVITTAKPNGKVFDSAPDTGCVPVPIDSDVQGFLRFR